MASTELYDALVRTCQQYGTTTAETYQLLHAAVDSIESEPADEDEDAVVCDWCGQEIGIIHYSDGDRWQVTTNLDEFCDVRTELADDEASYPHEPATD